MNQIDCRNLRNSELKKNVPLKCPFFFFQELIADQCISNLKAKEAMKMQSHYFPSNWHGLASKFQEFLFFIFKNTGSVMPFHLFSSNCLDFPESLIFISFSHELGLCNRYTCLFSCISGLMIQMLWVLNVKESH